MSKTPNYDEKIKVILDATKPGERICELTGEKWNMTEEEISWYKKFNVSPSKRSPQTRMFVLASFGNAYQWWYQKHPETGKQILTYVHPASGIKVLPDKEWFEQDFSCLGTDYEVGRSFFEQIYHLERQVPFTASRNIKEPENSLSVVSLGDQNDLLTFACRAKNSLFSIALEDGESSSEVVFGNVITDSYNISHSSRIFHSFFVYESFDCLNSAFLFDCRNCEYCFGATNKRNRKYLWWNEQLSKEEWEKRRSLVDLSCRTNLKKEKEKFQTMMQEAIWPQHSNVNAQNCLGEYLIDCTDLHYAFFCHGPKKSFWLNFSFGETEECVCVDGGVNALRCYQCLAVSDSSACLFCFGVSRSQGCEYCMQCYNCEHCFGCVGLNRKQFHIFNKQYSEEEYWKRVDEIKCLMLDRGEYGDYFPCSHSSAHFFESTILALGAANREIAKQLGANIFEMDAQGAVGNIDGEKKSLEEIPNCLDDFEDKWINQPIFDPEIGRRFIFFPQEIAFYREKRLAPPARHFIARVKDLLLHMNVGQYEDQSCFVCKKFITIAKNFGFQNRKVYCHECYLKYLEENG